jgi:hypothetical protein
MTEINDIRELFQRYAEEVGGYLPRRKRKDIQLEILSLLEDSLEDLSARHGRPADEAMALEVLKNHGAPIKFARAYQPDENLIRPETFQLFKPAALLVGGVLLFELLMTLGLSLGAPWAEIWPSLLEWFEGIFTALGILVVSFALIERTTPDDWLRWPFEQMFTDWDPSGLKASLRKKLVKPGEHWFEIVLLTGLIVWFAIFPQWVGVGSNRDGEWFFLPVLAKSFSVYLPWVILYWLGRLVFSAVISRQTYWTTQLRIWDIVLKAFGVGLLFAFLVGPQVIGLNPTYIDLHSPPLEMQSWVTSNTMGTIFYIVVGINLVVHFLTLVWKVFRLFRNRAELTAWVFPRTK